LTGRREVDRPDASDGARVECIVGDALPQTIDSAPGIERCAPFHSAAAAKMSRRNHGPHRLDPADGTRIEHFIATALDQAINLAPSLCQSLLHAPASLGVAECSLKHAQALGRRVPRGRDST
jgi:hypothetical protein